MPDLGCGHDGLRWGCGRGAPVTALDLSAGDLGEAGRRAEANGVAVQLIQAAGEQLPFADGVFSRIWGNAGDRTTWTWI